MKRKPIVSIGMSWVLSLVLLNGCVGQPAVAHRYVSPSLDAMDYNGDAPRQRSLRLANLDVVVDLLPGFARTTVLATFNNPSLDDLEGNFKLQLPEQAIVTGYALDIEEMMLDGVIGASPAVRRAYKAKVRGQIDPGIGEVTNRNEFVTSVYPIPAEGQRTIRVEFNTPHAKGHAFELPLATRASRFTLTVSSQREPLIILPESTRLKIVADNPHLARVEGRNVHLDGTLRIATRSPLRTRWERADDGTLFAFIPVSKVRANDADPATSIRVYWDKSLSAQPQHDVALSYLTELMKGARVQVELNTFDHRGPVPIQPEALETLEYGGATSFDALFASESAREPVDVCVVLSDGYATLGSAPQTKLPCRVLTVTSAPGANQLLLNEMALRHSGAAIDLSRVSVQQAVAQTLAPGEQWPAISADHKAVAPTFWSAGPQSAYVVAAPVDTQMLRVGGKVVSRPKVVDRPSGATLAPWWARQRLQAMNATSTPMPEQLELARRYSVLGEGMTFVVFEDLEDYIASDLPFPKLPENAGPELVEEYEQEKAKLIEDWASERTFDIDNLRAQWDELVEWYQTDFTGAKPERKKTQVPAPSSPQPAHEVMHPDAAADMQNLAVEEIIVTGQRPSDSDDGGEQVLIEPWSPDALYVQSAGNQCGAALAQTYRDHLREQGQVPIFHLHMGDLAAQCGDRELAVAMYTSALELDTTDPETYMAVGYRLLDVQDYNTAIGIFERIARLDEARPQPLFALARALVRSAEHLDGRAEKVERYERALEVLHKITFSWWHEDYDGISQIALVEANGAVQALEALGAEQTVFSDEWIFSMPADLRILLTWHADVIDLDLHVTEPHNETVYYSRALSAWGGRISNDMTEGYGPEEYMVRKARDGIYVVEANHFAGDRLNPNGPAMAEITVIRNWGKPDEKTVTIRRDLTGDEDLLTVARVAIGEAEQHPPPSQKR